MIEGQEETEQVINYEKEMRSIVYASMQSVDSLKSSIVLLCGAMKIESSSPKKEEVMMELQSLYIKYADEDSEMTDEELLIQLRPILEKAQMVQAPLSTPQL
jgi:hypothetical protein